MSDLVLPSSLDITELPRHCVRLTNVGPPICTEGSLNSPEELATLAAKMNFRLRIKNERF